jgi:hypothetical protein
MDVREALDAYRASSIEAAMLSCLARACARCCALIAGSVSNTNFRHDRKALRLCSRNGYNWNTWI